MYQSGTYTNFDIAQSIAPQSSKLEKKPFAHEVSIGMHWLII
jgi:hypothetical protein